LSIKDLLGINKLKDKFERASHDLDQTIKLGSQPEKLSRLRTQTENILKEFSLEELLWMLFQLESRKEIKKDIQELQIKVTKYGSKNRKPAGN